MQDTTQAPETAATTEQSTETQEVKSQGASAPNSKADTKTVQEQIAELEAKDFEKLLPIKDESGQVQKLKVKDVVKRIYAAENQAKRSKEQLGKQLDATLQELVQYAKSSPQDFLMKIGIDPYEFSESTLKQKVEMLQLSPEQKELLETKERLKKYEADEQARKQQEEVQQRTRAEHEEIKRLDVEMAEAFKETGLPKNKFFFQWATALMHDSLVKAEREQAQNGYVETEPLSAKSALAIVKERFPVMIREYLGALDPNQVKEYITEEVLTKVREADIARVQNQAPGTKKASGTPTKAQKEPKIFTSDHEWRAYVESKRI